jgi:CRP-like cAMP-binding protein
MAALSTAPALDPTAVSANRMLLTLSSGGQERLLRDALLMAVEPGDILYDPAETTPWVFFPLDCVVSILTVLADGSAVETATIGREGMVGTFQALGDDHNPNGRAVIQMGGELLRVDAQVFRHQLLRNPLLSGAIERYLRAQLIHISQSVACGTAHTVRERLARWLLQTSDRVASDDVRLTHEFLAHILHARRASVTVALRELQDLNCVTTRRGGTMIVDRSRLQDQTCECYDLIRDEYARLLPGELPAP